MIPKPSMKSSIRTSLGWIGAVLSVVVNDLHLLRSGVRPPEADSPLVVGPDAVLPGSVTLERFEPVTGRNTEVVEHHRGSHLTKFAQRQPLDPRIDGRDVLKRPQSFGILPTERSDLGTQHITLPVNRASR